MSGCSMGEIRLRGYKCERCYHVWVPRKFVEKPTICPACKTPYWNKPRAKRIQVLKGSVSI